MTGPDHYTLAGQFVEAAAKAHHADDPARAALLAAIGQAHATLAAAAAAALNDGSNGMDERDYKAWYEAAGVKPDSPR